ncbi:hypothetical protein DFQ27_005123 [Actinomortierella ambigua]|uniref:Leucine carboxyl methyltransferase 1 n=1 Tax=Actinomortierella ambigua TaxID=1343610 RepID=A0A9P6UCG8_9FUNG|nr:hypothetical protein DFQ27_005123 [Actinomortierella ambigua]
MHDNESGPARDDVIKGTDDDATVSRLSAVDLGYLDDPYVKHFVKRASRRPPIINRGTFLRTHALDTLVENFIQQSSDCKLKRQIVSLGAGSDTRYFKFKRKGLAVDKYFEIDFAESTTKKAMTIKKHKDLMDVLQGQQVRLGMGGTELYADDYCLLAADLREFELEVLPKLKAQGFDTSLPTLFLSECVLIYLQPQDSDAIVEWISKTMRAALFVLYEQIQPSDAFGAMMVRNLKARQIEIPGIYAYPSLESQEQRFLSRGWKAAKAVDMNSLQTEYLSPAEMERLSRLEIFDEVEEWQMLAAHYCVAWAHRVQQSSGTAQDANDAALLSSIDNMFAAVVQEK